jgi:hypothetical protein
MALRGKVNNRINGFADEKSVHGGNVADIGLDEVVSPGMLRLNIPQIFPGTGIGQGINVDDLQMWIVGQQMPDQIASDKPRPAGDQYNFRGVQSSDDHVKTPEKGGWILVPIPTESWLIALPAE